jgi:hypothetical protein
MTSIRLEHADYSAEHREGKQVAIDLFQMCEGRVIGRCEFTLEDARPPGTLYDEVLRSKVALIEEFLKTRRGATTARRAPALPRPRGAQRESRSLPSPDEDPRADSPA